MLQKIFKDLVLRHGLQLLDEFLCVIPSFVSLVLCISLYNCLKIIQISDRVAMSPIAAWKKIVDEDPFCDYKYHNKAGFIHYSVKAVVHSDDFNVVYGTYSSKVQNPSLTVAKSYKKKIDHEKNKLKTIYICLFHRYSVLKYDSPQDAVSTRQLATIDEVIYRTYLDFDRRVSSILDCCGFSRKHIKKIVIDIVTCVIDQCKNAPTQWANFGERLKKNLCIR